MCPDLIEALTMACNTQGAAYISKKSVKPTLSCYVLKGEINNNHKHDDKYDDKFFDTNA